jgi:hypothetical protein
MEFTLFHLTGEINVMYYDNEMNQLSSMMWINIIKLNCIEEVKHLMKRTHIYGPVNKHSLHGYKINNYYANVFISPSEWDSWHQVGWCNKKLFYSIIFKSGSDDFNYFLSFKKTGRRINHDHLKITHTSMNIYVMSYYWSSSSLVSLE